MKVTIPFYFTVCHHIHIDMSEYIDYCTLSSKYVTCYMQSGTSGISNGL